MACAVARNAPGPAPEGMFVVLKVTPVGGSAGGTGFRRSPRSAKSIATAVMKGRGAMSDSPRLCASEGANNFTDNKSIADLRLGRWQISQHYDTV